MTRSMGLCVAIFLLTGSCFNYAVGNYDKYVDLISDIREGYSASSVFFLFSRKNSHMQTFTTAHSLTLKFSDQGVFTLTSHFDRLTKRLNYYQKRIGRPVVAILLKSSEDVVEFESSTRDTDKSYPIWLIIFHDPNGSSFCDHCRRPPVANPHRLRFDTRWLVFCCDDPMLHEWWSTDGNRTEIGNFGTWNGNGPLEFLAVDGLNARRHDVRGTGLRVVIVANSPFITDYGDRVDGFYGAVLRELKHAMNFKISVLLRTDAFGAYNATSKSWSGAVGSLVRGEADLAMADLTMTASRLDAIDFTNPLMLARVKLFVREPEGMGVHWFAYFEAFASKIWIILIVLVVTTPLLLTFIRVQQGSRLLGSLYFEYYLCVWGIFCQQGLFEFPVKTPMRIAYFSIFVSALVVYVAYSASLISFLTVTSSSLPFTDLIGFIKDGSYKLIVYRNTSDYEFFHSSTDPIFKGMMSLMKPWNDLPSNPTIAWNQVCKERVALFTTDVERRAMNITCKTVGIDTGRVDSLAIGLPAGSQYNEVVNYHIQRFKANGMFKRLTALYYSEEIIAQTSYDVVEFSRVAPILSVLICGVILAIVVWTCETIYHENRGRRHFHGIESSMNMRRSLESRKKGPSI